MLHPKQCLLFVSTRCLHDGGGRNRGRGAADLCWDCLQASQGSERERAGTGKERSWSLERQHWGLCDSAEWLFCCCWKGFFVCVFVLSVRMPYVLGLSLLICYFLCCLAWINCIPPSKFVKKYLYVYVALVYSFLFCFISLCVCKYINKSAVGIYANTFDMTGDAPCMWQLKIV